MFGRRTVLVLLITAFIGAFLSGLLLYQHYNKTHENYLINMLCGDNPASGCDAVNRSEYSEVGGIPLAAFGLFFYLSLMLVIGLAAVGSGKTLDFAYRFGFFAAAFALIVDIVLLALQAFILKTFCTICLSTYAMTIIFLLTLMKYRRGASMKKVAELLATSEGKMFVTGSIIGVVMLAAAVGAANYAIAYYDISGIEERFTDAAIEEFEKAPVQTLNLERIPFQGSVDAPIKVVLYSDFLCPYCRNISQIFQQHIATWGDRIIVYFKSYPLDPGCNPYQKSKKHPGACWAALGSICAGDQGKFWEYHDMFFNQQPRSVVPGDVIRISAIAGLDTTAMRLCLTTVENRKIVRALIEDAHRVGVTGTPRIFVNGRMVPKLSFLVHILKHESEKLGLKPLEDLND